MPTFPDVSTDTLSSITPFNVTKQGHGCIRLHQLMGSYEGHPALISVSIEMQMVPPYPNLDYAQAAKLILPALERDGCQAAVKLLHGWESIDFTIEFPKLNRAALKTTKTEKFTRSGHQSEWIVTFNDLVHLGLTEAERQQRQLVTITFRFASASSSYVSALGFDISSHFDTVESLCQHLLKLIPEAQSVSVCKPNVISASLGGASVTMHRVAERRIIVALGSNLGNRWANLTAAVGLLHEHVRIVNTSMVYETKPEGECAVEMGGSYLNAVIEVDTDLQAVDLRSLLGEIECRMGRSAGVRNAPRIIDLDLIDYHGQVSHDPSCILPHPRAHLRRFVMEPLQEMLRAIKGTLPRYMQIGSLAWQLGSRTLCMGILNVTPDSFSDGGSFLAVEQAVQHARLLSDMDIIDVGGQSTRPGAEMVGEEVELQRVIPVICAIRQAGITTPISVDTFRAKVAQAAIAAGADMVNDVSGGRGDPAMLGTVAQLRVPVCLMHSRGTPQTMQSLANYSDLISEVAAEMESTLQAALDAGIPKWNMILDPGIGFAKTAEHNLQLLRERLPFNLPMLYGPSRKGFIGKITGQPDAAKRQMGTAACLTAAIALGADVVRVHDPCMVEVVRMADAIYRH